MTATCLILAVKELTLK